MAIKIENGYFEYEVEYWDEILNQMRKARGVTYAPYHAEAVQNIEAWYGAGNINKIKIAGIEPGTVYDFEDTYMFKIKAKKNKGDK